TIRIGDDTGIYHGTFFELGAGARVTIGDYCTLVGAILRVESELRIGNYVLISHEVVITDCESAGFARRQPARPITVGDDVWIGMRAIILSGVCIGAGAVVGAGALVCEDVPPMTIVSGNPARVVRRIAACARAAELRSSAHSAAYRMPGWRGCIASSWSDSRALAMT